MRNKRTFLSILAASVVGLSGAVYAEGTSAKTTVTTSSSMSYSTLDTDRDGKLSKREVGKNKDLATRFTALDTNTDGHLDSGEFALFEGTVRSSSSTSSSGGTSSSSSSTTTQLPPASVPTPSTTPPTP